ncbi:MAG TPA: hypothetical protein ENN65_02930, partial [Candidatus Hydrogenedentes bacterium]|nr:hypothetical protein [Candidatus Hydrogenedentota bacterium]
MNKFFSSFLVLLLFMHGACARPRHERDVIYGRGYMASEETEAPALQPLRMDIIRPPANMRAPRPAAILI